MLFSFLVAQYNNGKYFKDCYKSIIAQTYTNWEVIIVDDGSTDNSLEIIDEIIGDDTRFKIHKISSNQGCGFAKRECVKYASGEVCGFLDPDDAVVDTAVAEMMKAHDNFTDVGLVYSNTIYCNDILEPRKVKKSKQVINFRSDFSNLDYYISHFTTFKKSYYDKTSGIDDYLQRAVDQDLYVKLYEVGKVYYLDKDLYNYRVHEKGISTYNNKRKAKYWHWVVIAEAGRRRGVNLEHLFENYEAYTAREKLLEAELLTYNKSVIFKVLRKLGVFKI
ncbi:glycosyltransferase family 2 protein [Aequorivita sediminis]|uniref:glycosyltransferase family 2 protein n=1 Tax=Aequorivita sediminis TaxID=3073653 RepID=UPI0028A6B915|nr:glycosyltransferase [Aequorivita sp. F6058]